MVRSLTPLALILAASAATPVTSRAALPQVYFDMPFTVACRDVTPPEFASMNPGQKLIEARFEISSLLTAGEERDLAQYFIRIESPERKLAIVDYLPKTLHESLHAGPISIQDTDEKTSSLGINISGQYEFLTGAGANAGIGQKNISCVKYDLLPPLETVAASGTLMRGSAVFFKLKSSQRNLLEGSREYAVVLRVPDTWRADYVRVRCEAEGIARAFVSSLNERVSAGKRDFVVALYQEGDEPARVSAENFARRQGRSQESGVRSQKTPSNRAKRPPYSQPTQNPLSAWLQSSLTDR